jgi:hypothetical protein
MGFSSLVMIFVPKPVDASLDAANNYVHKKYRFEIIFRSSYRQNPEPSINETTDRLKEWVRSCRGTDARWDVPAVNISAITLSDQHNLYY